MDDLFGAFEGVEKKDDFENLPKELVGLDLTPDPSEKLVGDFPTLMDYITISFRKEQSQELADLLGLPMIDSRRQSTYTFDAIKARRDYGLL